MHLQVIEHVSETYKIFHGGMIAHAFLGGLYTLFSYVVRIPV